MGASLVNFTSQDDSSDLEWDPQCHLSEKDSEVIRTEQYLLLALLTPSELLSS